MPAAARHTAHVSPDGELTFGFPSRWHETLRRFAGQTVTVTVKRLEQKVTLDQHGYYRAVLLPLAAEEWGWADPSELHAALKRLHLPGIIPEDEWPVRRLGAYQDVELPSMADFTREQSSRFIDAVIHQMQEAGIVVPAPRGSNE